MLKYEQKFQKAISLAITIKHIDESHDELDCKTGPEWADKIHKLIEELSEIINSLNNSQYNKYCNELNDFHSPESYKNIKCEWDDVRKKNLIENIKQIFKKA